LPPPPPPATAAAASQPPLGTSTTAPFAPWGPSQGALFLLEDWEVDRIIEVVGGHLKDLDTVVTAITKGTHWSAPLERLVADSVEMVERRLEEILYAAGGPAGAGAPAAGGPAASNARSRWRGVPNALPSWDYGERPAPERLAAYTRYLRAWAMISDLASRKYIAKRELQDRIFAACPQELDYFVDAGLIMSINVKTATKQVSTRQNYQLETSLPGTYVSASSPRMRVAFRVLVSDARLQAHTARIAAAVQVAQLRAEEARLAHLLPELTAERQYAAANMSALLARDTALRTSVAKELLHAAPAVALAAVGATSAAPSAGSSAPSWTTPATAAADSMAASAGAAAPPSLLGVGPGSVTSQLAAAQAALAAAEAEVARVRGELAKVRAAVEEADKAAALALSAELLHSGRGAGETDGDRAFASLVDGPASGSGSGASGGSGSGSNARAAALAHSALVAVPPSIPPALISGNGSSINGGGGGGAAPAPQASHGHGGTGGAAGGAAQPPPPSVGNVDYSGGYRWWL
jgi:hypothetical protein